MREIDTIRRNFLSAIVLLGTGITILVTPLVLYRGYYEIAVMNLFLVVLFLTANYYIRRVLKEFTLISSVILSVGYAATIFITFFGDNNSFLWFVIYPPATMFAFGLYRGIQWNILTAVILGCLLVFHTAYMTLNPATAVIIFCSYSTVLLISIFLERARTSIENKLKVIGVTDFLTSAKNRRGFDQDLHARIEGVKRHGSQFCLIILDLDRFKQVNDKYGHSIGDEVLIELVELIRASLRPGDSVYRIGGEEFTVIIEQSDLAGGKIFAERLKEKLAQHKFPGVGRVTVSMGLVQYRTNDDREETLKRADRLLYLAKERGRDRIES